jgi:hypothetical protein
MLGYNISEKIIVVKVAIEKADIVERTYTCVKKGVVLYACPI